MRFEGIIFDMDGVLCDSEPFIREAACRMFAQRHNTKVTHADFAPFTGQGENRFIGGVAGLYGVTLDLERDKALTYSLYLEIIQGKLDPLPGAVAFIRDCRRRGLKLAVATSADQVKLDGNLKQIGLPPATFDAIVTGSEVERKKPHPDIFQAAAKRLGLANEVCLVVEDAPAGIEAGKAAGSKCLGLTTSFSEKELRGVGADWIAPDLANVPKEMMSDV